MNPGNQMLQESLNSRIYVDKSGIIGPLNELVSTQEKYVCVSRPRRFGKTMTGGMLVAYYGCGCDSREQFAGLAASELPSFERHLNAYNVIHLNNQDFLSESCNMGEMLEFITEDVVHELSRLYPDLMPRRTACWQTFSRPYMQRRVLPSPSLSTSGTASSACIRATPRRRRLTSAGCATYSRTSPMWPWRT